MTATKTINNNDLFTEIESIINGGGTVSICVKGNSMRPFLRNGRDTVMLTAITKTQLRCGMVVLFRNKGKYILHRIRRIDNHELTIKGDGNYRQTEKANIEDVLGYVYAIERNEKTIRYGSLSWHLLTAYSIARKAIRALWMTIRYPAKR